MPGPERSDFDYVEARRKKLAELGPSGFFVDHRGVAWAYDRTGRLARVAPQRVPLLERVAAPIPSYAPRTIYSGEIDPAKAAHFPCRGARVAAAAKGTGAAAIVPADTRFWIPTSHRLIRDGKPAITTSTAHYLFGLDMTLSLVKRGLLAPAATFGGFYVRFDAKKKCDPACPFCT